MMQNLSDSKNAYRDSVRTMNLEQFDAIVKAIIEGKYSWACVLILRFAGYNPAHYIPYRTYKRLIKENRRMQTAEQTESQPVTDINRARTAEPYYSQVIQSSILTKTHRE